MTDEHDPSELIADLLRRYGDARIATERERLASPAPCGHALRHWRPSEGTATGAILFDRNPAEHGLCEVCRAAGAMREAAAAKIEEQSRLIAAMELGTRHVPLCSDLAAAVRALPLEGT